MNSRLLSVIRKEILHIIRDRRTFAIMFVIPIIELVLLGYAATNDIRRLTTAVYDADRTQQSRQLIEAYRASDYFAINRSAGSEDELAAWLDNGQIRAGIIIPAGYADNLAKGKTAQVGFVIDGSDPVVASTAFAASQSVGQSQGIKVLQERIGALVPGLAGGMNPAIEVRPRVWYNPELRSANYMVPAVMGIILQFLTTLFTALTIVREREQGTIEQLVVTPIKSWELVVGKVIPYVGIAFFDLIEVLILGMVLFGVYVRGNIALLLGLSILFLLTTLGLGLLVSSIARTQQESMFMAFLTMLPSIFLSGFFFPLEAMPGWLQAVSYAVPLRYMLVIIRGIMMKGVGMEAFPEQVLALLILGPLILFVASMRFRKSLE
ncbi:MAG: ABC transporter permease [Chloroflexi bacterium]|nr:ABC transporter permease [Chloroflexota bacterium]